jgi:hypothetical protein
MVLSFDDGHHAHHDTRCAHRRFSQTSRISAVTAITGAHPAAAVAARPR